MFGLTTPSDVPRLSARLLHVAAHPGRNLLLIGSVIVLALLAGTTWLVVERRAADIAAAANETQALAGALAEATNLIFRPVDFLLRDTLDRIRIAGIETPEQLAAVMGTEDVQQTLRAEAAGIRQIDVISVVNADGRLINFSRRWPVVDIVIASRDYFRVLREDATVERFISAPVPSLAAGHLTFYMSRPIRASNGRFLGMVVAGMRPEYFTELYAGVSPDEGRFVGLHRLDGAMLGRYPTIDHMPSVIPPVDPLLEDIKRGAQISSSMTHSPINGISALRVGYALKDFPLVVVVGRSEASILAGWRRQTIAMSVGAVLATMALMGSFVLLARQIARRATSETALAGTLDNVVQGIMMIDEHHRVSICNRRAIDMLNLPPEMMATRPKFDDLLRFKQDHGEFGLEGANIDGAVRHFLLSGDILLEVSTSERRRHNGTVLEISSVPLPGGGMVRTYTDVTAAREREAALQAALAERDEAEAELRQERDNLERELARRTKPIAESEARHRDAAEVASDWIWETDSEIILTFVSKRFGDTSGIPWSQVNGRAFADLVALGFDPDGMAELRAMIEAHDTFQGIDQRVIVAPGNVHFWRLSGKPFFDPATGAFAGYRGTGTDVTAAIEHEAELNAARLRAEAAEREARRAQARLVEAIEAIPEGFVLHDAEDRLVLCNTRYGEIYGLTPDLMAPGLPFEQALRITFERDTYGLDGQGIDEWITKRVAQHRAVDGSHILQLLANGRWLQVEERRTSDGGTVGIRIDVTEARQREAVERDRDRATAELQAARLMQTSLLPSEHLQQEIMAASGLDIASRSVSCSELGGDLWGLKALDHGRVGVYTVDFAGHGTTAALNTFRLHTLIHELGSTLSEPAHFLKQLNRRLTELLPPGAYATMFYAVIDPNLNRITYAGAGAPPPIMRPDKDRPLIALDSSGVPLGITVSADYVCAEAEFGQGAMLLLYSDMLTDYVDESGRRAGEEAAFDRVQRCAGLPTAEQIVSQTCAPFLDQQTIPLSDDLTVVCILRP